MDGFVIPAQAVELLDGPLDGCPHTLDGFFPRKKKNVKSFFFVFYTYGSLNLSDDIVCALHRAPEREKVTSSRR
jgi:hypothetical protein